MNKRMKMERRNPGVEDKLYVRPILLSKSQLKYISKGELVCIRRNKQTLYVGKKGYSNKKARLLEERDSINLQLKALGSR